MLNKVRAEEQLGHGRSPRCSRLISIVSIWNQGWIEFLLVFWTKFKHILYIWHVVELNSEQGARQNLAALYGQSGYRRVKPNKEEEVGAQLSALDVQAASLHPIPHT
jgi:hypothetical protein